MIRSGRPRALCAGCAVLAQPIDIEPAVRAVLTTHLRFSDRELDDVRRGRVAKHGLPSRAPGEVAVAGAVRIGAPKAAFFARVRDIARFKSGRAGPADRPVQQSAGARRSRSPDSGRGRFRRAVVPRRRLWRFGCRRPRSSVSAARSTSRRPDAPSRASTLFKQILLETVTAYVSGAGQVTQYDDGSKADPAERRVRRHPRRHAGDRRADAGAARSSAAIPVEPASRTPRIFCTGRRKSSAWRRSSP